MAAGAGVLATVIARHVDTHRFVGQALDALLPVAVGALLYTASAAVLRSEELSLAGKTLRRRLAR
jgi:hypothetical protein